MRLPLFLFLVLLAMALAVGIVLIGGEPGERHGVDHPQFASTMQQGGPGPLRHDNLRWLGWVFGTLQITFFVGCLLLGVKHARECRWPILFGALLYLVTFALLAWTDHAYAHHQPAPLVLSFPLPTALLVYGLWAAPCVFMLIYVTMFDRWILTPEDLQRFRAMLQDRRDRQADDE